MAVSISSSVAPGTALDQTVLGRDSAAASPAAAGGGAATSSPNPGQDQVTLSSDAMAALANAQGTSDATQGTTQPADGQSPAPDKPSTLKSFAYGSLGLEHPDQQDKDPDTSYSVGRWLAAAVTAGTLVSLLV